MRGPLSLVIDDGNGERHVTRRTRGLRFKRSAYGGDVDATCTLNLPRNFFTDLGPGSTVNVLDGRTGGFVWRGSGSQPGVTAGPRGEMWDLQAFGGAERLQAITDSLAYVHALDADWKRTDSTKGAQVDQQEKSGGGLGVDGTPTLEVSWAKLFELENGDQGMFGNRTFAQAGLKIGRIKAEFDAGRTDSDLVLRLLTGTDMGSLTSAATDTASTGGGTLAAWIGGGGITLGDDVAGLRLHFDGSTLDVHKNATTDKVEGGVPDKTYWARFWDVIVRQVLKDKYGDDITDAAVYSGAGANTVTVTEVIRDMIGRGMCPGLDPDKVTIGDFDYGIDALSWLDGIKMGDALTQLRDFEPQLTWQVYGDEGNFDVWPEDPRYVISSRDGGVTQPGDDSASLADRVYVSWTDRRGRQRVTKVTDPDVPVKQEADPITLPEGVGSEANAQRAGEKALALHNNPPKAGTAVIRRRIMDLWTGALVLPHEVQPACLAVVQETGDLLRVTETDYSDDDAAVVLTLGEPRKPLEAVIADLERKQRRHRR